MHSFELPQLPSFISYCIYVLLLVFTFLIFRKIRKNKNQKQGCGIFLFYIIGGIPFCYLLLKLTLNSIYALYGITFYPKYEATIVDSVSKYSRRSEHGRKIYLNYAVLELKNDKGDTIRIDSNEGTNEEIKGSDSVTVSYQDGFLVEKSFWSIIMYIGTIIVSTALICVLLFFFYTKT